MSEPGDVIEKMAREICHYAPLGPSPLNSCCQTDPPMCVQKARACHPIAFNAALESLREPTGEMVVHGDEAIIEALNEYPRDPTMRNGTPAQKAWRAMFNTAIVERGKEPP